MTYIYFDESGDLGFDFAKKGTSGQFSVAFLILTNKRPVSSAVKKVFLSLPISKVRKHTGELHAYKERASTRRKLLANLATKDILIATMRLDKKKVLIADNPHDLYASIVNSLVNRLFVDGVINGSGPIQLIASRRDTSQTLNRRFSESVASSATTARVSVEIMRPAEDKCLQAVDFISWAFWQKYEKGNDEYADLVAQKVVREYEMFDANMRACQ